MNRIARTFVTTATMIATCVGVALVGAPTQAAGHHGTPVPVNHHRYNSVNQWTIRSHVAIQFHKSGHFVTTWLDDNGDRFQLRSYPAVGGGEIKVVFYHYISPRDGDYGWVLWTKRWIDPTPTPAPTPSPEPTTPRA